MGTCTSRTLLFERSECSESQGDFGREVKLIPPPHRLVRNQLRKEVQYDVRNKIKQARNSISLVQVPSKSVQQKDVRPILSSQTD